MMFFFFFFNDTATTEIYTLSYTTLFRSRRRPRPQAPDFAAGRGVRDPRLPRRPLRGAAAPAGRPPRDRKSTRLNSSHANISYAVFCLKKKKEAFSDRVTAGQETGPLLPS